MEDDEPKPLPKPEVIVQKVDDDTGFFGYGTRTVLGRFCVPDMSKLPVEI